MKPRRRRCHARWPKSLAALGDDKALRAGFGDFFVDYYLKLKQAEIDRFNMDVSDWEQREYFSLF